LADLASLVIPAPEHFLGGIYQPTSLFLSLHSYDYVVENRYEAAEIEFRLTHYSGFDSLRQFAHSISMPSARSRRIWATILCASIAAFFAVFSWAAVSEKSFTTDEPGHALDGYFMSFQHDFRFWCNSPPLWEYWISLGSSRNAIEFNAFRRQYRIVDPTTPAGYWLHRVPPSLIWRGRALCLILGVALAILTAFWAWQLGQRFVPGGGLVPAVAAISLICFDPNFLGHAPLVKSDVAIALCFLTTTYAIWKAGTKLTWISALAVPLLLAVTNLVKFSGPLMALAALAMFLFRALSSEAWPVMGRLIRGRAAKFCVAAAVFLLAAIVTYAGIWASYGFRFNAGPNGMQINLSKEIHDLRAAFPEEKPDLRARLPFLTRLSLAAAQRRLIPQGFAAGLIFTDMVNQGGTTSFLFGRYYGGEWLYFPVALLVKEPIAYIVAMLLGLRAAVNITRPHSHEARWAAICLAVPVGIYALAAMASNMNVGFRYFLPVLPFVAIGLALAAGAAWKSRLGKSVVLILGAGLLAETLAAFPNYIAFFNAAAAGHRQSILSDSNLDWGQDLPLLAEWQRNHPGVTIYLNYSGHDLPRRYGIDAINLNDFRNPPRPRMPAVAAVSMTFLQLGESNASALRRLGVDSSSQPDEVLGGTICIFRVR
jgi:hypothetical protein